jgi:hypothetical protein
VAISGVFRRRLAADGRIADGFEFGGAGARSSTAP